VLSGRDRQQAWTGRDGTLMLVPSYVAIVFIAGSRVVDPQIAPGNGKKKKKKKEINKEKKKNENQKRRKTKKKKKKKKKRKKK